MQLTLQHWLVLVLPIITMFTTFFIAEEYAVRNISKQEFVWKPLKLHVRILAIMIVGLIIAILLGYLSYVVIFKGFLN